MKALIKLPWAFLKLWWYSVKLAWVLAEEQRKEAERERSTVRAYEVTIKVTFTTGAKELAQRVEHAYTPVDAVMQAILNTSADKGATQLVKTELVNVSVPQKLILSKRPSSSMWIGFMRQQPIHDASPIRPRISFDDQD